MAGISGPSLCLSGIHTWASLATPLRHCPDRRTYDPEQFSLAIYVT
jgi:hypothetical protein